MKFIKKFFLGMCALGLAIGIYTLGSQFGLPVIKRYPWILLAVFLIIISYVIGHFIVKRFRDGMRKVKESRRNAEQG
jgi:hypothetical protein